MKNKISFIVRVFGSLFSFGLIFLFFFLKKTEIIPAEKFNLFSVTIGVILIAFITLLCMMILHFLIKKYYKT